METKLEKAGVIVPGHVLDELESLFALIDDKNIVEWIQDSIILSIKKRRDNGVLDIRLFCLYVFFKCFGLSVLKSKISRCPHDVCENIVRMYVSGGYKSFDIYDRMPIYEIESMDDFIVKGLIAYRKNKYYRRDVFGKMVNAFNIQLVIDGVHGLKKIYPHVEKEILAEYVLCYLDQDTRVKLINDVFIGSVGKLQSLGIDFFEATDKMFTDEIGMQVDVSILKTYVTNVALMKSANLDFNEFFANGTPDYGQAMAMAFATEHGVVIRAEAYRQQQDMSHEYIYWTGGGLPLEKYLKIGYKYTGQLKVLRFIFAKKCNPVDFKLNPDMPANKMLFEVEKRLGVVINSLSLEFGKI